MKAFLFVVLVWINVYSDNEINYNPRLTQYVMQKHLLKDSNFYLVDVGASGGIAQHWKAFGKDLSGFGFDPLVNECARLNALNTCPKFRYLSCYIVSGNESVDQYARLESANFYETTGKFARSSAWKMMQLLQMNYGKEAFNQGEELILSHDQISLDAFFLKNGVKSVDFIKIDTDGFDYSVLKGSEKLLNDENMIGILVECHFNAAHHPYANSFRNIDSFLAEKGFSLFDLSVWRYTKGELPGKFVYKIPAQTISGQVTWGDAFYLRDFIQMQKMGKQIPTAQILKMACVQEIFGLPDCAAELLLTFRDQLKLTIDVDHCLDLLAADMGLYSSYRKHLNRFQKNPTQFYPTK